MNQDRLDMSFGKLLKEGDLATNDGKQLVL